MVQTKFVLFFAPVVIHLTRIAGSDDSEQDFAELREKLFAPETSGMIENSLFLLFYDAMLHGLCILIYSV